MESLPEIIHHVARGKRSAGDLTRDQARLALGELLSPGADPLQLGAFLIALRVKGETPAELAGFTEAARALIEGPVARAPVGAVDIPCYAGKRRTPHLTVASALLARAEGIPVLFHGCEGVSRRIDVWPVLEALGIHVARSRGEAGSLLASEGIVYLDLAAACPPLAAFVGLRERLGVRSFAHTVARLLNPLGCDGQVNGGFHPGVPEAMAEANATLAQPRSLTFRGVEGEPEMDPGSLRTVCLQEAATVIQVQLERTAHPAPSLPKSLTLEEDVAAVRAAAESGENPSVRLMLRCIRWAAGKEATLLAG